MRDVDLDSSDARQSSAPSKTEIKRKELKLANKLYAVEEMLKKKYFFTKEQLYNILHKNTDHDGYFYEQIIDDAEQKYNSGVPLDIPISTYIYDALMGIESLDIEKRKQEIRTDIGGMIKNPDISILSYEDFTLQNTNGAPIWQQMKIFVKKDVQDFYVVHIDDTVGSECLPVDSLTHLKPDMNLYVFVQKDLHTFIVRSPVSSMDDCLDTLAKKYSATRVTIPLSHFFPSS